MKLKYSFETVEIDGQIMAVPVGDNADQLNSMLRLNDTAAFILGLLKEDREPEDIINTVIGHYSGDAGEIRKYVGEYLEMLKSNGIAE